MREQVAVLTCVKYSLTCGNGSLLRWHGQIQVLWENADSQWGEEWDWRVCYFRYQSVHFHAHWSQATVMAWWGHLIGLLPQYPSTRGESIYWQIYRQMGCAVIAENMDDFFGAVHHIIYIIVLPLLPSYSFVFPSFLWRIYAMHDFQVKYLWHLWGLLWYL